MMIDARDISWRRESKEVLSHVTWQVRKGEQWSLVGLNGSGKTTLLKMINGYIWPTSGTLSVLGHPFGQIDLRRLRRRIGWVSSALASRLRPQEHPENIVLSGKFASIGLYDEPAEGDRSRAKEILERLDCSSFSNRPFGTLSEGEKQRVLIGRAWMASPELLILDEPCNGLDIFAREQLLSIIRQMASSPGAPTMIFVTHHVDEILPCFNHTLLLKAGAIYQSGLTRKIMTPENMTAFYGGSVIVEQHGERLSMAIRS
ncbi:ABC transporter ATP-binding protein [Sporolactobacillus pectinivorans]|uniref:ABC transporter ATP-binding protein n=1 Tax=Sporolactobacillus pectinivorans TaxID=1591408 RepID=UPI000C263DE0|nr:ABC transporter ATP-binding protein [Sporolactobacillus pectinivorans]